MICRDVSFEDPVANILYDEVLLQLAEEGQGGEVLRFWESPTPFIVLGKIGKVVDDLHCDVIHADQVPVLRRSSGGGTVVQGKGCLNYTVILNKTAHPDINDLKKSYSYILGKVVTALEVLGVQAIYLPISDIALVETQKKISGNAQKRVREHILHHGTILYDFDLTLIWRYLKMPVSIPDYRHQRTHEEFVTNIPVSCTALKTELQNIFSAHVSEPMSHEEKKALEERISQRYATVMVDIEDKGE